MKITVRILAMVLTCILVLSGCRCSHTWDPATCADPKICQFCGMTDGEALGHSWKPATCNAPKVCETCKKTEGKPLKHTWTDATCAAPKTCTTCGLTEGETLVHNWVDANCETPKTCTLCAATEGVPLGHVWQVDNCDTPRTCAVCDAVDEGNLGHSWVEATCNSPKTCSVCNLTEGKALGHQWQDATTEKPKTCTACGKTEGSAIETDPRFTTAACQELFGTWKTTLSRSDVTDFDSNIVEYVTYTFKNNGTGIIETGIDNFEEYKELIADSKEQEMYTSYAEKSMTKEEADAACKAMFGVTVPEFAAAFAANLKNSDYTQSREIVYYINNGQIYIANSWSDKMDPIFYKLNRNKLTLFDEDDFRNQEFTRV